MYWSPLFPSKEEYNEAVNTIKEFQNNVDYDLVNIMDYMCIVTAESNEVKRRAFLTALANSIFSSEEHKLFFYNHGMIKTLFNYECGFVNKDCNVFLIPMEIDDNVYCYYFIDLDGNIIEKRDTATNCVEKIYHIFRTQYSDLYCDNENKEEKNETTA